MRPLLFSTPSLISLDILPHEIRLIQLKKTKHGFILERLITHHLAENIFIDGKIKHWQILSSALSKIVKAEKLQGMAAAIILPATLVRTERIQLPQGLTEADIETEIHAHIQRSLPGMSEALCIDFNQTVIENSTDSDVFYAAVREEYLSQYRDCVNEAGLVVKIADVDIYALKRAICFETQSLSEEIRVNAILYLTRQIALFMVFNDQEVLFYHYLDRINPEDVLAQLKSKIQLYFATFKNIELKTIAVCGEEAYLNQINAETMRPFCFEMIYPKPFSSLKIETERYSFLHAEAPHHFLIACGAAMQEVPRW